MKFLNKLFLPDNNIADYDVKQYITDLNSGKFRNYMNLGLMEKDGNVSVNLQRFDKSPNALYIGAMGSGKSVAANFTLLTWMLSNSDQTVLFIVDTLKGANDYQKMFDYEQVYRVHSEQGVIRVIDLLYDETMERRDQFNKYQADSIEDFEKKSGKKMARVVTLMEEFHVIPNIILDFERNYKNEGSAAFKFFQLMKIGRSYGIWFIACSQKGTKSDVPPEIVPNFTQKQIFKVSRAESSYFLGDTKAGDIKTDQKGRCETDFGPVQFPFIPMDSQDLLLKKYMKPLKSECLYLTDKLIKDYLGGNSTEELYRLKKITDLCKGIESFDANLVIAILHKKLGHKVSMIDDKVDTFDIGLIVEWDKYMKLAVTVRTKSKITIKHLQKLLKGMVEYNCPRGIVYTSQEDVSPTIYKFAHENNIEIVDHEDLIKLARRIENKKIDDLAPDTLADSYKEELAIKKANEIGADYTFDEDPIVELDKGAASVHISSLGSDKKISEVVAPTIEKVVEETESLDVDEDVLGHLEAIKSSESVDEETKLMAERIMIKQYKSNIKPLKRVPVKGSFELSKDKVPMTLIKMEKNASNETYRALIYIVDTNDKKILHRYFLDKQVESKFSDEELTRLEITGTNAWNTFYDSLNRRLTLSPDTYESELIEYFDANLKAYDFGNIPVICWGSDSEEISTLIEKTKTLKSKPLIIEDLFESNFGQQQNKDELLNTYAKNIDKNEIFNEIEKLYEIFKAIF